jgi:hypothetical protein
MGRVIDDGDVEAVLPEHVEAWVCAAMGPATRVRRTLPLAGGTQAAMHVLDVVRPNGSIDVVLRRYRADEQRFAAREVLVLGALGGLGGLIPQLLAADVEGSLGQPTLLLSRLPGRPVLSPTDLRGWTGQLAEALARIHGVWARAFTRLPGLLDELHPALGSGSCRPLAAGWSHLAAQPSVLTHGDYWTGNVLWHAGRLTGVVDWATASLTPRGSDVGNCRLDLVLMLGEHAADGFLDAYQQASGNTVPNLPLWDLLAGVRAKSEHWLGPWLRAYHAFGRVDLDAPTLEARLDQWITRATRRSAG